ncbi:MAG: TonB-dependent receptor, partial [Firmicutes bacterium]|nr:TonB-dependent receptor [Bacillota bacterium]
MNHPSRLTFGLVAALVVPGVLSAQTTIATLHGKVRAVSGDRKPLAGAAITVVNTASGFTYNAKTLSDGSYVLVLSPATYRITVTSPTFNAFTRTFQVQVGQNIEMNFGMVPQDQGSAVVEVLGKVEEVKTSEVATNITTEQIQSLPQNRRSFLDFAALAPGIRMNTDENDQGFSSGGQSSEKVNLFIDGASYKNDLLRGGVMGQDSSKGNPFPTSAVQEFRVLTENYKAEYQKASAAIITAVTKSGTNDFHGELFTYYQDKQLVANDYFAEKNGTPKPTYQRLLWGASVGGPIITDKLHFFLSFEQNRQDRDATVRLGDTPAPASQAAYLKSMEGTFPSPFRSNLLFGKIDYQIDPTQVMEFTVNYRNESDIRSFGEQTSYESAENMKVNVQSFSVKHRKTTESWINEAMVTYQRFEWNPQALNWDKVGINYGGVMRVGGRDTSQDFVQKRTSLRDDFTLIGIQNHTIKTGINLDFLDYHVVKYQNGNPVFFYDAWYQNWAMPHDAVYGVGNPDLSSKNRQFGIYVQDDWNVTPRLQLNLGIRWDYESELFNTDYVTPLNIRTNPNIAALGLSNYMTDGSQRKAFYGAFQPRLGFSYDLSGKGTTMLFGGVGRYYDRETYNNTLDEKFRLQYPVNHWYFTPDGSDLWGNHAIQWDPIYLSKAGLDSLIASGKASPEIFLLNNDTKPPYSDQMSLGVRHTTGTVTYSLTLTSTRSQDNLTWTFGNRDANHQAIPIPGYSNVLINTTTKTWYDAAYVVIDRPYTEASGWGLGFSYTLANAKQTGDGMFSLNQGEGDPMVKHRSPGDERHRVVVNGIVRLPWGFRFSGVITLGSGTPYTMYDASHGWGPGHGFYRYYEADPQKDSFIIPNAWAYRSVDVKLQKDFKLPKSKLGLMVEAINLFNYHNWTYGWDSGLIPPPPDVNT